MITEKSLSDVDFSVEDIKNIISNLDSNKAYGDDMISIRMLKLCDKSICKPLSIFFKSCLMQGIFPSEWEEANVVPIHKKNDKHCVNNYRHVSLLPICSKVLESIIYNTLLTYFIENNLISEKQSGFRPGNSCINQLLAITHEIFSSFDDNYEVRGVFLDISKAFDKVWHEGIIHKLKPNGISENLLSLLTDFLRNRKQRVILNGQSSSWANINAGVPEGSILGPLLFLIYINDLSGNIQCNPKLFADGHIKTILTKMNRTIGLLRKFQQVLPRPSLITIYKAFIRPHLDYGDVIFDQAFNNSFHQRLESIQYNTVLAITGAIRGTSKEKLYQELGFESLQSRRWFRKLSVFYKIIKNKSPSCLYYLIPKPLTSYSNRNSENLPPSKANHSFFKNTFFHPPS